jgi:radical SAM protein with 4Fe4S-binding SPASM domain
MDQHHINSLEINWQGGEIMVLPPSWYDEAFTLINGIGERYRKTITHFAQSNLISYSRDWLPILNTMFNSSIGSSLDFPNLYRKLPGGRVQEYDTIMHRQIRQVQEDGLHVGIIALPNEATFVQGARSFYDYYVHELQLTDFQINTPFPGGFSSRAKTTYPLDSDRFTAFLIELIAIWLTEGYEHSIQIGPFDRLLNYFLGRDRGLSCIWGENCANEFFCIDPFGNLSQCDCWAASYPDFHFGNLLTAASLDQLLADSPARKLFLNRPAILMEKEDCIDCPYLALCHGGCPVRAYTVHHDIHSKDPYCQLYKPLFAHLEEAAACLVARSIG